MAKWSFGNVNWTPTATADAATMANATYQELVGGSTTQRVEVIEIYIAGMAGASSPTFTMFALDSTKSATPTALAAPAYNGPLDSATAALAAPQIANTAATTGPQRSNATTLPRLNLGLNAFGGIVRWLAAPREEFILLGNATSVGAASLSAFTGGTAGAVNTHIVYEPL